MTFSAPYAFPSLIRHGEDLRGSGRKSCRKGQLSKDKDKIYIDFDKEQAQEHEELGDVTEDGLDVVDWRAAKKLVVIDPGHGGNDPGSQAIRDGVEVLNEKDINLDIALRLNRMLNDAGVSTYMLRTEDTSISLYERPRDGECRQRRSLYIRAQQFVPGEPQCQGNGSILLFQACEPDYGNIQQTPWPEAGLPGARRHARHRGQGR
jgi:hypothetical protein